MEQGERIYLCRKGAVGDDKPHRLLLPEYLHIDPAERRLVSQPWKQSPSGAQDGVFAAKDHSSLTKKCIFDSRSMAELDALDSALPQKRMGRRRRYKLRKDAREESKQLGAAAAAAAAAASQAGAEESLDSTEWDLDSTSGRCARMTEEIEQGNIEYKLKLLNITRDRLKHLITQLKWRLGEGCNVAVYKIGVRDNGDPVGITRLELDGSLKTLKKMVMALGAQMEVQHVWQGEQPHLRVAEVIVRSTRQTRRDIRVALLGAAESGKSTLVGVMKTGVLDDGNGSARVRVFKHLHEVEDGRTSSISTHMAGIDSSGRIVRSEMNLHETFPLSPPPCRMASNTAARGDRRDWSANHLRVAPPTGFLDTDTDGDLAENEEPKVISFSDLAGHRRYIKTTLYGLMSRAPDYAAVCVSSAARELDKMSVELLGILSSLKLPFFVVITKSDLLTTEERPQRVHSLLSALGKHLERMGDKRELCIVSDCDDSVDWSGKDRDRILIFPISCRTGAGNDNSLSCLQKLLQALEPHSNLPTEETFNTSMDTMERRPRPTASFSVLESFRDDEDDENVLIGIMEWGTMRVGDSVLLGPLGSDGKFTWCSISSIHQRGSALPVAGPQQHVALKITLDDEGGDGGQVLGSRKGMILLKADQPPSRLAVRNFEAAVTFPPDVRLPLRGFEPVIFARNLKQAVKLVSRTLTEETESGSVYSCAFRFLYAAEFLVPGSIFLLWDGTHHAVGTVTDIEGA